MSAKKMEDYPKLLEKGGRILEANSFPHCFSGMFWEVCAGMFFF